MGKPNGSDIARHYAAAHQRLAALVDELTDDELAAPVPATPGWSVHDVLAHLAAIPTDAFAGRLSGVPTDEFTAGQVAERRDRSAAELLAEWTPNVAPMCDGARADLVPPQLAVDALTHEQDIRGALGREPALTADELRFCTTLYGAGSAYTVQKAGLRPLRLEASDSDFVATHDGDEPAATLRAPEFEIFRALSGRRGRGQVLGYDWTGDPAPYLPVVNIFGPLPDSDLPTL